MGRYLLPMVALLAFYPSAGKAQGSAAELEKLTYGYYKTLCGGKADEKMKAMIELGKIAVIVRQQGLNGLTVALDHGEEMRLRVQAARTIAEFGPLAKGAVPYLLRALDDKNDELRIAVMGALVTTAPYSKEAIPKIISLIKDKNPLVRRRAISALRVFGAEAKDAVPLLMEAFLKDPDNDSSNKEVVNVRTAALLALAEIGPSAKEAVPVVVKALEAGDLDYSGLAHSALSKILPGDERLVSVPRAFLKDPKHANFHHVAAGCLYRVGPEAKEAVPELIAVLKGKKLDDKKLEWTTKYMVIQTLAKIGPDAKEAIPALQEVMRIYPNLLGDARGAIEKIRDEKD